MNVHMENLREVKSHPYFKLNILIQRNIPEEAQTAFRDRFPHHEIRVISPQDSIDSHLAWAEVILSNPDAQDIIKNAKSLKWLQLLSSGFDGYEEFEHASFKVTTAHGIHAIIIAEHILMMMLLFERKQRFFEKCQREGKWDRQARLPGLLKGQTLGIIGYGAIAKELLRLVKPFGFKIQAVTRRAESKESDSDISIKGMEYLGDLLSSSDHIVVALPSVAETRQLLNAQRIGKIKDGAYLYNVGRGDLIEESALIESLESGHLGGAALDVFESEPLDNDSPLWKMDNCIITPHIAGHHKGLDLDILEFFSDNLDRFDNNQPLNNEANFKRGY